MQERSYRDVPSAVLWILTAAVVLQVLLHQQLGQRHARSANLPPVPTVAMIRPFDLGDDVIGAKLLMLWLQHFDNRPGLSIPLMELDYVHLTNWLKLILKLDPRAQYPLLAASRIYAEVHDEQRQRVMLDFIETEFLNDPNGRWRWLAHAVYVAKHRLQDNELALAYARRLHDNATGPDVPSWAKQMFIFVLEDIGELEAAKIILGGLLDSGKISDPHEQWFLSKRLQALEEKIGRGEK